MTNTTNNLNTYKILFLIKGILNLFYSLFFILYMLIGMSMGRAFDLASETDLFSFNPANIFVIIGFVGFIFTITLGVLTLLTSKFLSEVRNYNFIFVMAILNALTGVLGILLAVFTCIELQKSEVKVLFSKK